MERASSRARWQAAAAGADQDVLLSLPTAMLDNILGRLPFDDLVRTSRLSPAWRRRWQSVPGLHIHFREGSDVLPNRLVLWQCASPVGGFTIHLRTRHVFAPARLARWLLALARKRVQKLVLTIDDDRVLLGPGIFSCNSLTHLELHGHFGCRLLPAPHSFGGLTNLATLILDHVLLPFSGGGAQLQKIISSAPHLRFLSLMEVRFGRFHHDMVPSQETCTILAPDLRILKLMMLHDSTRFQIAGNLLSLEEAAISVVHSNLFGTPEFRDSFRRISNVKVLSFHTEPSQLTVNPLEGIYCSFQNLRTARLTVNFAKRPSVLLIFPVLGLGPFIEKLTLKVDLFGTDRGARYEGYDDGTNDDDLGTDNQAQLRGASFGNLRHISLDGMLYLPNDRWFMMYVLSKARSLESCVVTFGCWEKTISYVEGCREMESCQKASPQVKLTLKHRGDGVAPNEDF